MARGKKKNEGKILYKRKKCVKINFEGLKFWVEENEIELALVEKMTCLYKDEVKNDVQKKVIMMIATKMGRK